MLGISDQDFLVIHIPHDFTDDSALAQTLYGESTNAIHAAIVRHLAQLPERGITQLVVVVLDDALIVFTGFGVGLCQPANKGHRPQILGELLQILKALCPYLTEHGFHVLFLDRLANLITRREQVCGVYFVAYLHRLVNRIGLEVVEPPRTPGRAKSLTCVGELQTLLEQRDRRCGLLTTFVDFLFVNVDHGVSSQVALINPRHSGLELRSTGQCGAELVSAAQCDYRPTGLHRGICQHDHAILVLDIHFRQVAEILHGGVNDVGELIRHRSAVVATIWQAAVCLYLKPRSNAVDSNRTGARDHDLCGVE